MKMNRWVHATSCGVVMVLGLWGCGSEETEPAAEIEVPTSPGFPGADDGTPVSDAAAVDPDSSSSVTEEDAGPITGDPAPSTSCTEDTDCAGQVSLGTCEVEVCLPSGTCGAANAPDSTSCEPLSTCIKNGACAQGKCIGQPVKCDDGNPCTDGACKEGEGCVFIDSTAPCDDMDSCTTGDLCMAGKCVGQPVANCGEALCGDGVCDSSEGCDGCPVDCGPCDTEACSGTEVTDCNGACIDQAKLGDGSCDPELDCGEKAFDGGDCQQLGECDAGGIEGCGGVCLTSSEFTDLLVNDTCDEVLNCEVYGFDFGDCDDTSCEAGVLPCPDGSGCYGASDLCDGVDDCSNGFDEMNCDQLEGCPPDKTEGCTGTCYPSTWLGDGTCDSFLDCEETGFDNGDCSGSTGGGSGSDGGSTSTCGAGERQGCATSCYNEDWFGDGMCDSFLNCAETAYDDGDCQGSSGSDSGSGSGPVDEESITCETGKTLNCSGSWCYSSDWIGDGECDSWFDCSETSWDGGDCLN